MSNKNETVKKARRRTTTCEEGAWTSNSSARELPVLSRAMQSGVGGSEDPISEALSAHNC